MSLGSFSCAASSGEEASKALIAEAGMVNLKLRCCCDVLRAVLIFDPGSRDALYLYGRACKDAYEQEDEDESYWKF